MYDATKMMEILRYLMWSNKNSNFYHVLFKVTG